MGSVRSEKTVEWRKVFVLTPESLVRLINALPIDKDQLKFTVTCTDNTTLYPNSVEELLAFPNPKTREIQTIQISTPYEAATQFEVYFSTREYRPASYAASGEDANVVSTTHIIEQHLEAMAGHGLHFISTSENVPPAAFSICLMSGTYLTIIGLIGTWSTLHDNKPLNLFSVNVNGFYSFASLAIGATLLTLVANGLRPFRKFFPRGFFCIGDGATRHQRVIEWRKRLGWGAIISLVIGIVGRWITSLFIPH